MPRHMQRELESLRKKILTLSTIIEENVYKSVKSFMKKDLELANKIIEMDKEVDLMEIAVEEECLKILALHQPVAVDLRFIVAILKLNNDLERIGDMAVNISERAVSVSGYNNQELPFDFSDMAEKVEIMLKKSLDALVGMNPSLAQEVCDADDEIDDIYRNVRKIINNQIANHPDRVDFLLSSLSVACCLERIADHTTNIAEDVIYMTEGQIIRHRLNENRIYG